MHFQTFLQTDKVQNHKSFAFTQEWYISKEEITKCHHKSGLAFWAEMWADALCTGRGEQLSHRSPPRRQSVATRFHCRNSAAWKKTFPAAARAFIQSFCSKMRRQVAVEVFWTARIPVWLVCCWGCAARRLSSPPHRAHCLANVWPRAPCPAVHFRLCPSLQTQNDTQTSCFREREFGGEKISGLLNEDIKLWLWATQKSDPKLAHVHNVNEKAKSKSDWKIKGRRKSEGDWKLCENSEGDREPRENWGRESNINDRCRGFARKLGLGAARWVLTSLQPTQFRKLFNYIVHTAQLWNWTIHLRKKAV